MKHKGMTLIEVCIYVALTSFLITTALYMLFSVMRFEQDIKAYAQNAREAQYVLSSLESYMPSAQSCPHPCSRLYLAEEIWIGEEGGEVVHHADTQSSNITNTDGSISDFSIETLSTTQTSLGVTAHFLLNGVRYRASRLYLP